MVGMLCDVKVSPRAVPAGRNVYQLKVTLNHTRPTVWRRILVPGDFNFEQLAKVIVVAMGWKGDHLYQFMGSGFTIYGADTDDVMFKGLGESYLVPTAVKVSEIFKDDVKTLKFEYDFGDGWMHKVVLENIVAATEGTFYPVCSTGKNACPPEDCGGIGGYEELLDAIKDPNHEKHKEMSEWLEECGYGKNFDPAKFVLSDVDFD